MDNKAISMDIPVHERIEALALIHDGKRCHGVIARCLITGELRAYVAKSTTIATGGYGRIYEVSTNAIICEGIGQALALKRAWQGLAIWKRYNSIRLPSCLWHFNHGRLPW